MSPTIDYYQIALHAEQAWFQSLLDDSLKQHRYKDSYDQKRRRNLQLGLVKHEAMTPEFAVNIYKATKSPIVKKAIAERFPTALQ